MTTPPGEGEPDARQWLNDLHYGQGLSYREIARRIGRNPRLLAYIAAGQKPGRNLAPALRELALTGQVTTEPERRTVTGGGLARVRGRRGQPSVVPPAPRRPASPPGPAAQPADQADRGSRRRPTARSGQQPDFTVRPPAARNTFRQQSDVNPATLRGNHSLQAPKARWSTNRWQANDAFAKIVDDAARLGLRLHAALHVEIGTGPNRRRLPPIKLGGKGGYDARNVDVAVRAEGGDSFTWLASQIEARYPEFQAEDWTVIAVDVDVW